MESAATSTPRRVLRVLLASGFLALGWVAVDLIAHAEPAAAAQTIDLLPLVDEAAATVTDTVESTVAPVVTAITDPVEPVVSAVVAEAIAPLVTEVVTPVVDPILEATEPIVAPILLPIIEVVDEVAPVATVLASAVENEQLLIGSALVVGSLLAASIVPLIPAPTNGAPLNAPLAPNAPTGSNSSILVAIYGELNSGILALLGALRTGHALGGVLPPSPTFAFDTTPD